MFTGIIVELGTVDAIEKTADGARLSIHCPKIIKDASIGDSIAVNGICLTISEKRRDTLYFDISRQSLNITTAHLWKIGDKVNLEPALRIGDKMGGHFVTGHVEDTGKIISKTPYGNAQKIFIEASEGILNYTVEKGSISVDGISLTVVDVNTNSFSVVIIPHTYKMTTLGYKNIGEPVNLEPDMLAKYIYSFVNKFLLKDNKDKSLMITLQKSGYL